MIDLQQMVRGLRSRSCGAIGVKLAMRPRLDQETSVRSTLRVLGIAPLVRADHRPGRAGADTGSETSDRSVPGLVPDESAHHVDHPDRQSCRFRILRARGGSCSELARAWGSGSPLARSCSWPR